MRRAQLVGIATLLLMLTACGSLLPTQEPLPTLFVIPTLTPMPPADTGGDAPAPTDDGDTSAPTGGDESVPAGGDGFNLDATNQYGEPTGVSSYRVSLAFNSVVTASDGSQTSGSITAEGARTFDPSATSVTFTGEGTADFGTGDTFVFTEIEGVDYIVAPEGGCFTTATGETETPYSVLLGSGGILGELSGAQPGVPPMEMVNGVMTNHFVFDETSMDPTDPGSEEIISAQGDIYLAKDGGYVVRIVMTGQGINTLLNGTSELSDISYELNYFDFNQPVDIMPPPGCDSASPAEAPYPVLPDATSVTSAPGLYTYNTLTSFEDAVAFYQTGMPAEGYTLTQELVASPNATLTFTGADGSVVQVNIVLDPTSGGALVAIAGTP